MITHHAWCADGSIRMMHRCPFCFSSSVCKVVFHVFINHNYIIIHIYLFSVWLKQCNRSHTLTTPHDWRPTLHSLHPTTQMLQSKHTIQDLFRSQHPYILIFNRTSTPYQKFRNMQVYHDYDNFPCTYIASSTFRVYPCLHFAHTYINNCYGTAI